MNSELNNRFLEKQYVVLNNDSNHKLLRNIVNNTYFSDINIDNENVNKILYQFNNSIGDNVEVTNQYRSGRCWIFAGLNVIRRKMISAYGLTNNFELSQSFVFFYDKLEKCNMVLEIIFKNKSKKYIESLKFKNLFPEMLSDGGTWNMLSDVIQKYGIIPKYAFPDSMQSKSSMVMNDMIKMIILKGAYEITSKDMKLSQFRVFKEKVLSECFKVINICIGQPPTTFVWNDKQHTPHSFYKSIVCPVIDITSYVSICTVPTERYNQLLGTEYKYNVVPRDVGGNVHRNPRNVYYNLDPSSFKNAVCKCLKNHNSGAWFACDFSKFGVKNNSILDPKSSLMNKIFDIDFVGEAKKNIRSNINEMNHAMMFAGYNKERNNKVSRWQVENSHGSKGKYKGYIIMSDDWFDKYVNIAVVPKTCLPRKGRDLDQAPIKWLKFWSFLGFVAK